MKSIDAIESIPRKTLHEQLVERLREIILEGGLEAGAKIPERELCERLGVSRTPMREALKVLASEGLVSLVPNRGAVVRGLTREDIDDLFPLIGALEALAGELACERISDSEIAAIERLHADMVAHSSPISPGSAGHRRSPSMNGCSMRSGSATASAWPRFSNLTWGTSTTRCESASKSRPRKPPR